MTEETEDTSEDTSRLNFRVCHTFITQPAQPAAKKTATAATHESDAVLLPLALGLFVGLNIVGVCVGVVVTAVGSTVVVGVCVGVVVGFNVAVGDCVGDVVGVFVGFKVVVGVSV